MRLPLLKPSIPIQAEEKVSAGDPSMVGTVQQPVIAVNAPVLPMSRYPDQL